MTEQGKVWLGLLGDVRDGQEANRYRAGECHMNRVYLSGESGVAWSQKKGLLRLRSRRQEPQDDRMLQHYRWLKRKLFKTRPQLTAHAGGMELIDAERACVAERIFDYWRANNGWEEAEEEAYRWVFPCGRAFIEPVWRKVASRPKKRSELYVLDEPTRDESTGELSYLRLDEVDDFEGDIAFRVLDPNATYMFPLTARRWEDVERVVSIDLVTHTWLEDAMGEEIAKSSLIPWEEKQVDYRTLDALHDSTGGQWSVKPRRGEELYLLVQSRERPTFRRPNGRLLIAAGGRVLRDEDLPYVDEARRIDPTNARNLTMGIVPWFSERVVGSLQPPAPATILRKKQREIVELMRLRWWNRWSVGLNKILAPEGSFDKQKWDDNNGQILYYNRSQLQSPPQLIPGQPLVGLETEIAAAERSFDESAGRPSVLRGENPPQVRGAFHFEMLYEEASEILALDVLARERLHEQAGLLALEIWRRRASREQVERIYGKERTSHVWAWMSTDVAADLRVKTGSSMPRNYAAVEAKLVELLQYGAFAKPDGTNDYQALWSMLELGQINRAVQEQHAHRLQAENNFARMLYSGDVVYPQEWEEHGIHVEVFRQRMARPEFYDAAPERRAIIQAHLNMRVAMAAMQAAGMRGGAGVEAAPGGARGLAAPMGAAVEGRFGGGGGAPRGLVQAA